MSTFSINKQAEEHYTVNLPYKLIKDKSYRMHMIKQAVIMIASLAGAIIIGNIIGSAIGGIGGKIDNIISSVVMLLIILLVIIFNLKWRSKIKLEYLGKESLEIEDDILTHNLTLNARKRIKKVFKANLAEVIFNEKPAASTSRNWWYIRLKVKGIEDYVYVGRDLSKDEAVTLFEFLNEWQANALD